MNSYCLIENGKVIETVELPNCPNEGDIVSNANPKDAVYLVKRVEYVIGNELINLHVETFLDQLNAVNKINGFRNDR